MASMYFIAPEMPLESMRAATLPTTHPEPSINESIQRVQVVEDYRYSVRCMGCGRYDKRWRMDLLNGRLMHKPSPGCPAPHERTSPKHQGDI